MTVNEAMLKVAESEAKKYGYIEVSKDILDAKQDSFWGNRVMGYTSKTPVIITTCKYILPVFEDEKDESKSTRKIYIDMYWGKPRLGITQPDGTFVCLTYKDNVCSEVQAFRENGLKLALSIKEQIDNLLKQ